MVAGNLAKKILIPIETEVHIAESPVKWCAVPLSDVLSRNKRLEASVFDVEAKQARERILNGKYKVVPLYGKQGLVNTAYYPGRFKRIYCDKDGGIGFYLPSQMTDIYPKPEKFISRSTNCDISALRLKPHTLLLTRSGTIGTVSYVSKTIEGCVFSDDVIRVSFKKNFDLGYVYTFLKSKTGNLILQTNGYGSVITHLEPEHLAEIQIPDAPTILKQHISDLVECSYALRDESNELIDEATRMMMKELHLPAFHVFHKTDVSVNTFGVKLSRMNLRLDASYHLPVVDAIVACLKENAAEVTTIGDSRVSKEVILPGRFKRVYVEEGYGIVFFSGKNIKELDPNDKRYLSFTQHNKKIKDELTLAENMILVTCSGTIGHVTLVPKHWDGWAMTHDIIRCIPQSNIAGYTYIWLNSEYANTLLQAKAYGSVVQHIEKEHFMEIPIPLLQNKNIQRQINDLALEANAKRYEAYRMEQEALRIMNEEVIFAKYSEVL